MIDFLPDNYEVPSKNDGYMKFVNGDNRFRILSKPIIGWEWWIDTDEGRRPQRIRMSENPPVSAGDKIKHFWAFVVWNYDAGKFQILEVTQKGIQKSIKGYAKDEDWGSPDQYDIVVTRSGDGLETEYEVKAKPAKLLDPEIQEKYEELSINLEALYDGADPFSAPEVSAYERAKATAESLRTPENTEPMAEDEIDSIVDMLKV